MRVAVDVWQIDLAEAAPPSAVDLEILSAEELARHARYLVAEPARIFATTRIALRRLLALRSGRKPSELLIDTGAHGKPFCSGASPLFFNVSHCATTALIALCDAAPVGIDVDAPTAIPAESPMEASICTTAERAWIRCGEAPAGVALARLWIRKEAVLKACGTGLTQPMSSFDLGDPNAMSGLVVEPSMGRVVWRDLALTAQEFASIALHDGKATSIDVVHGGYPPLRGDAR